MTLPACETLLGAGEAGDVLDEEQVRALVADGLGSWNLDSRKVLVIVPDATRTAPMPLLFRCINEQVAEKANALTWLIALGTHAPMADTAIAGHLGLPHDWRQQDIHVVNHEWSDARTFVTLGEIPEKEIAELSGGLIRQPVPVRVNRMLLDYDVVIVVGPVFPHEVVGFSGGNKYFFPGVSSREMIDASHWLGALITASEIMGTPGITPVRKLIDRAAGMLPVERRCIALVVRPRDARLHGLYLGSCEQAWAAAAELSQQVHITYVDRAFDKVVAIVPPMYSDLWTAAKGVYKLEPVVADGGELILLAPHVHNFSVVHGDMIRHVGYHCRDFFLAQPDHYRDVPLGVLAHSTHVRGRGVYDTTTRSENCRIRVTLATAIAPETCEAAGLGWRDPASIDRRRMADEEGTLIVERAGEVLYRVREPG